MKIKKYLKWYYIIPAVIILILIIMFGGWYIKPSKHLNIAVLDKTVSSANKMTENDNNVYRKHKGLFWMLEQQKYKCPSTGDIYNVKSDYYGAILNSKNEIEERDFEINSETPDVVYLADAYGNDNDEKLKGLTYNDIAFASYSNLKGSTVIGESDITSYVENDSILTEAEDLFGISYTGWKGRYIKDMKDTSDIPEWALKLYQKEYGKPWDYTGPGIMLVSSKDDLIVLGADDFNGKNYLTCSITPEFKKEFGNLEQNYYNWFELVDKQYDSETVAEYSFDLNDSGKEKLKKISENTTFPAVIRKKATEGLEAPAYYFAGDFNDFVGRSRYSRYLFSDNLYRAVSYDKPGDTTNFYWKFYYPLVNKILNNAKDSTDKIVKSSDASQNIFSINKNKFIKTSDDNISPINIKGFNINGVLPNSKNGEYTRDERQYYSYLEMIGKMGGNSVKVLDLMPPEFYRALYSYNFNHKDAPIYFVQGILPPSDVDKGAYLNDDAFSRIKSKIDTTVDAINGNSEINSSDNGKMIYFCNVSSYLMGYVANTNLSTEEIIALNSKNINEKYDGKYVSATGGIESVMAKMSDEIFFYSKEKYGLTQCVGVKTDASLSSLNTQNETGTSISTKNIKISNDVKDYFFESYDISLEDDMYQNNKATFTSYRDDSGAFPFGDYVKYVSDFESTYPVLIDGFGLSANINSYEKDTSVNGLSEKDQGKGIVRMLDAIKAVDVMGGFITSFDDDWNGLAEDEKSFISPVSSNCTWVNKCDRKQTNGIVAIDTVKPDDGLIYTDTGRMKKTVISQDAAYLYLTITLDKEINFDAEQLIVGLDTYQRNNGEYLYDKNFFANSLSGMEYVIKFESKISATLNVVPSYNKNNGKFYPTEGYNGDYDYVATLPYGSFDSGNLFYQTGSTVYVRIPWALLNFTNPSTMSVLSDDRDIETIKNDPFGIKVTSTDGIIFSMLIGDKGSKDTSYIFPLDKQSGGFKRFSWEKWSKVDYQVRTKESYDIVSAYFLKK